MSELRRWLSRWTLRQLRVRSAIRLPRLPRRPRIAGSVWAVTMVRDEADIIGHTVRHLLRQGVDGVIVLDHRSTDGTCAVLAELTAEDPRVAVGSFRHRGYPQARVMSVLADRARRAGADWVILFDADEFWYAEQGTVAERLRAIDGPRVIGASCHDLHPVSADGVNLEDPAAPLVADERPNTLKVAIRPSGWVWVDMGNHTALDLGRSVPGGLRILHAQYRRPQQLRAKAATGAASVRRTRGLRPGSGHHWAQIADSDDAAVADVWRRHLRSPGEGVSLTVGGLEEGWPRSLVRTDVGRPESS